MSCSLSSSFCNARFSNVNRIFEEHPSNYAASLAGSEVSPEPTCEYSKIIRKQSNKTDLHESNVDSSDISASSSPINARFENSALPGVDAEYFYEDNIDELLESDLMSRSDTFDSLKDKQGITNNEESDTNSEENLEGMDKLRGSNKTVGRNAKGKDEKRISMSVKQSEHSIPGYRLYSEKDINLKKISTILGSSTSSLVNSGKEKHSKEEIGQDIRQTSNMQDSIDTGYASGSREIDSDSFSSEELVDDTTAHTSDIELEWDNEPSAELLTIHNQTQSLYFFETASNNSSIMETNDRMAMSLCTESIPRLSDEKTAYERKEIRPRRYFISSAYKRRSRSLADIELSLDEKVNMLREEKTYVQRKIQESINEDKIRQTQGDILKGHTQPEKRDILLKTLYDLKSRLEDQSARLQSSYSTVLTLRKRFSQRRNSLAPLETSV